MEDILNYPNPHLFAAVLDNISHRFILVMEYETIAKSHDNNQASVNLPVAAPFTRFSMGAINAARDPRNATVKQLVKVAVGNIPFQVPPST